MVEISSKNLSGSATEAEEANTAEENEECCICMTAFGLYKEVATPQCGHKFHATCLSQWETDSHSSKCPMCRAQLREVIKRFLGEE